MKNRKEPAVSMASNTPSESDVHEKLDSAHPPGAPTQKHAPIIAYAAQSKLERKEKTDDTQEYVSSTTKGKGRNFGKLAALKGLPLDIFFVISEYLLPIDILSLSRVSKEFNKIFASRSSRHIWVAARRNVFELPECPDEISEMKYASLIYEHICAACGTDRAQRIDWGLRLRFCGHCFKENVQRGKMIAPKRLKFPSLIFTLVPRSFAYNCGDANLPNSSNDSYYVIELRAVMARYELLKDDPESLAKFIREQQDSAQKIMKHAVEVKEWLEEDGNRISRKTKAGHIAQMERIASIEAKLLEMGYDEESITSCKQFHQWGQLANQPRRLTPCVWSTIKPQLVKLLASTEVKKKRQSLPNVCVNAKQSLNLSTIAIGRV